MTHSHPRCIFSSAPHSSTMRLSVCMYSFSVQVSMVVAAQLCNSKIRFIEMLQWNKLLYEWCKVTRRKGVTKGLTQSLLGRFRSMKISQVVVVVTNCIMRLRFPYVGLCFCVGMHNSLCVCTVWYYSACKVRLCMKKVVCVCLCECSSSLQYCDHLSPL